MFARGHLTRIALPDTKARESAALDVAVTTAAAELSASTPASRRVRVAGRLDVMGASQGVLKLEVRPGVAVAGVWDGEGGVEGLKHFFNQDVVIEGLAVYRPSGSLLRLDVQAIAATGPADDFFRAVPSSQVQRDASRALRLRSGEASPYARIFGSIPVGESDEDFLAAVEALS